MDDYPRRFGEAVDEGLQAAARAARRLAYLAFGLLAFGLVLIGKIDARLIDSVRAVVADATAPALDLFSYPLSLAEDVLQDVVAMRDLRAENERLREENAKLAQLRLAAHRLQEENQSLRRLMRFDPGPGAQSLATRVVADTGGLFARSVMVHVGTEQGLRNGLAVFGTDGLAGRVQSVGQQAARVLLLTDLNSKIPVAIGEGRIRAIMSGRNDSLPALEFFRSDEVPTAGALVVTSGDGGLFHPGLPIGIVRAGGTGGWHVRPFVDWDTLDHVRIIDFGPAPTAEAATLSAAPAATVLGEGQTRQ
jgi:rod shape-determining protein MreC